MPEKPTESAAAREKIDILALVLLGLPDSQMYTVRTVAIREVSSEVTDMGRSVSHHKRTTPPHLISL
jgi:hypothetical protein